MKAHAIYETLKPFMAKYDNGLWIETYGMLKLNKERAIVFARSIMRCQHYLCKHDYSDTTVLEALEMLDYLEIKQIKRLRTKSLTL